MPRPSEVLDLAEFCGNRPSRRDQSSSGDNHKRSVTCNLDQELGIDIKTLAENFSSKCQGLIRKNCKSIRLPTSTARKVMPVLEP